MLQNPSLVRWFRDFNDSLIDRLDETPLNDKDGRQRIADLMWLARKFKQNLEFTVSQGYFAKKQLDAMLQPKKESIREVLFGR